MEVAVAIMVEGVKEGAEALPAATMAAQREQEMAVERKEREEPKGAVEVMGTIQQPEGMSNGRTQSPRLMMVRAGQDKCPRSYKACAQTTRPV